MLFNGILINFLLNMDKRVAQRCNCNLYVLLLYVLTVA